MNRKVSVAPMMDCTDKHERFFLRLISKNVLLYTEMIVSEAIDRGDRQKLLSFNLEENKSHFSSFQLSFFPNSIVSLLRLEDLFLPSVKSELIIN